MRFDDYIQATNAAEEPEALFALLARMTEQAGYTNLAYTCSNGPLPTEVTVDLTPSDMSIVLLKFPQSWLEHYFKEDCHLIDPVLQLSHTLVRPYTWDWLVNQPQVERESKIFMMDAEEAGLRDGVTIPMTAPNGSAFTLTLARDEYGDPPASTLRYLHGVGLQFHYAYCSTAQFRQPQTETVLATRTVQCLTLLAGGMTVQQISDHLKIPEKMVRHHLHSAAQALGARTPAQTVYEAIRADLIPLEAVSSNRRKH